MEDGCEHLLPSKGLLITDAALAINILNFIRKSYCQNGAPGAGPAEEMRISPPPAFLHNAEAEAQTPAGNELYVLLNLFQMLFIEFSPLQYAAL